MTRYYKPMKIVTNKRKRVVAISGGFDPIHIGHVRLIQEAARLGDELVVIINNDHWLRKKKGFVFMSEKERKEVIEAINGVARAVLTKHPKNPSDMSVQKELARIKPHIFANGGDRTSHNTPEVRVCRKIGCEMVFRVGRGGKIQSSSWLVAAAVPSAPCYCKNGKKFKKCHGS